MLGKALMEYCTSPSIFNSSNGELNYMYKFNHLSKKKQPGFTLLVGKAGVYMLKLKN